MTTITQLQNPWKGLYFYTEKDQSIFFGRHKELADLLRLLQRDCLTTLFARSGMGKTSLLRAGLMPSLRDDNCLPLIVRIIPSDEADSPSQQIFQALQQAAKAGDVEIEVIAEPAAQDSETLWEFFHRRRFWGKRNDPIRPVIILDQFEELFTLGQGQVKIQAFLNELGDLVENRMPLALQSSLDEHHQKLPFDSRFHDYKVLLSLREDFVPFLDRLQQGMPAVMRNRYCLEPLRRTSAIDIVLSAGGRYVSREVAEQIVNAVSPYGKDKDVMTIEVEPAYLSVMCHELFRRMVEKGQDSIDSQLVTEECGSILSNLYTRSFAGLQPATQRFVEDRLLSQSGYRLTLPLAEADKEGVSRSELEQLVNLRLLRFEHRLGTNHVELSHDLLREIVQNSRLQRIQEQEEKEHIQHEAEMQKKLRLTRLWAGSFTAISFALITGLGLHYFGKVRPSITYSTDFVRKWGQPQPVGTLPWGAEKHRRATVRITRQGWWGPVKKLEVLNSRGKLTQHHNLIAYKSQSPYRNLLPVSDEFEARLAQIGANYASLEYTYDKEGKILYETARDRMGQIAWGLAFMPHSESTKHGDRTVRAVVIGPDGYPQAWPNTKTEYIVFERNSEGYDVLQKHTDINGSPTRGEDQVYAKRMEYANGRLQRLTSLDKFNNPMADGAGQVSETYEYDAAGNKVAIRAFTFANKKALNQFGFHEQRIKYDHYGRETEYKFFNTENKPVKETDRFNAYKVSFSNLDSHGNPRVLNFFDRDGLPIKSRNNEYPRVIYEYNNNDLPTKACLVDQENQPLLSPGGWHCIVFTYDSTGNALQRKRFFDKSSHPVNDTYLGAHRVDFTYDPELKYALSVQYFGTSANGIVPVNLRVGDYHKLVVSRDKNGNVIDGAFFDRESKRAISFLDGYHRFSYQYDRYGNRLKEAYFDVDGSPIGNNKGFHVVESKYDEDGNLIEKSWRDQSGQLVFGPGRVHIQRYGYIDHDRINEKNFFLQESSPQLALNASGIAEIRLDYNSRHQPIREQYFALNGSPIANKQGVHRIENSYDQTGTMIMKRYFDQAGKPTYGPEGYHQMVQAGRGKETQYFDKEMRSLKGFDPSNPRNNNFIQVPYIDDLSDYRSPAYSIGLREGDIILRYGNWSLVNSWAAFRDAKTLSESAGDYYRKQIIRTIQKSSASPTTITVLRNGRMLMFDVPPLPKKLLGFVIQARVIPAEEIAQWDIGLSP